MINLHAQVVNKDMMIKMYKLLPPRFLRTLELLKRDRLRDLRLIVNLCRPVVRPGFGHHYWYAINSELAEHESNQHR